MIKKSLPFIVIAVFALFSGCQNGSESDGLLEEPCYPGSQLCLPDTYEYIYICNDNGEYEWRNCPEMHFCNVETMQCDPIFSGDEPNEEDEPGEKPEICQSGERFCDGDIIKTCVNGDYTMTPCSNGEYCDAVSVSCKPVVVEDEPGGCSEADYEVHCYGKTLMTCEGGDVVSRICDDDEICDAVGKTCKPVPVEEPDPGCQCTDAQYCDTTTHTCVDKACDNAEAPKCVNGYALKFCENWQYKTESCGKGYRCKAGQCYMPETETEDPVTPPAGTTDAVDGLNCPAGLISASETEAKRCVMDKSEKLSEDEFYCQSGAIDGRYCRVVPEETGDSIISVQSGQYCTAAQLNPGSDTLRVHVIDVGQGDAIWIQTPTGQNVLIDGGEGGAFGATSAGPIVRDYLTFHGFKPGSKFDAVFLTHPHSDHYGGLPHIFNHYGMKNYIDPMALHTTEDVPSGYLNWIEKVEGMLEADNIYMPAEAKFKTTAQMPKKFFGSEISAYYITSSQKLTNASGKDQNENRASLIFQLNYAGRSFLFTGDAEAEQEANAVKASPKRVTSHFLKVCHHGSTTSTTTSFLDAVWSNIAKNERAAFISSGRKSFAGTTIPAASVVNRLTSYLDASQLYSTSAGDDNKIESEAYRDDNILVVVKSDGSYYACYAGPN